VSYNSVSIETPPGKNPVTYLYFSENGQIYFNKPTEFIKVYFNKPFWQEKHFQKLSEVQTYTLYISSCRTEQNIQSDTLTGDPRFTETETETDISVLDLFPLGMGQYRVLASTPRWVSTDSIPSQPAKYQTVTELFRTIKQNSKLQNSELF
jgi:hypothetical protein